MIQRQKTRVKVISDLKALDRKSLYVRYVEDEHQILLVGYDKAGNGYAIRIEPKRPLKKPRRPRQKK